MSKQVVIINGNNFSDLEGFYSEVDRLLTKDLEWETGHNLNAFNDLLRGGFGICDYEEPVRLIWENFEKSKQVLGQKLIGNIVGIIESQNHIEFTVID